MRRRPKRHDVSSAPSEQRPCCAGGYRETESGEKLLMNKYSDKMFSEYGYSDHETFESSEAALTAAGEDDFCSEDISPAAHRGRIGSIVIYRWNRHYPSDLRIEGDLLDGWAAVERMDFEGNSHRKNYPGNFFERRCRKADRMKETALKRKEPPRGARGECGEKRGCRIEKTERS